MLTIGRKEEITCIYLKYKVLHMLILSNMIHFFFFFIVVAVRFNSMISWIYLNFSTSFDLPYGGFPLVNKRIQKSMWTFCYNMLHGTSYTKYYLNVFLLTSLEIEHLHWYSKDQCKDHWERNNHSCNHSKKIMLKTKVASYKPFYCCSSVTGFHAFVYISILWSHQSIQTPCYWINPTVPSPPHWDSLSLYIKEEKIKIKYVMTFFCAWKVQIYNSAWVWKGAKTYRSWDYESWEEIPHCIECRGNYRRNVLVWGHCYWHHAIVGEG